MANVTNLRTGSSGDDVKKLQQALIDAGYDVGSTGADGIYGAKTTAAVKQYQKDNGLAVDGIAGKNTQGALYGNSTKTTTTSSATNSTPKTTTVSGGSSKSAAAPAADTGAGTAAPAVTSAADDPVVQQALAVLDQVNASKPGAYQSQWMDEADSYLSQYQNRDPFSYNFNDDAMYHMYKDMFTQQGQLASMDVMGQAAAMTGGYGNSYAQTVGQQAYNQYLQQLNEIIPQLEQRAYDRYQDEGQELLNMYGIYMDRDQMDYGRYMDSWNQWATDRDYATGRYDTAVGNNQWQQSFDHQVEQDAISNKQWEDSFAHQKNQDAIDNKQYQEGYVQDMKNTNYNRLADLIANTGYEPTEQELADAGMTKEQAAAYKKYGTTGSTGSKGSGSGNSTVSRDDDAYWTKEVQRTVEDGGNIDALRARMKASGLSDDYINSVFSMYGKDFQLESIRKELDGLGGDTKAIESHLEALKEEGKISRDEALDLMEEYMPTTIEKIGDAVGNVWDFLKGIW